jgi:hypothetical protein
VTASANGRTLVKLNDLGAARRAYQDALAIWKEADANLPAVEGAREDYARLAVK